MLCNLSNQEVEPVETDVPGVIRCPHCSSQMDEATLEPVAPDPDSDHEYDIEKQFNPVPRVRSMLAEFHVELTEAIMLGEDATRTDRMDRALDDHTDRIVAEVLDCRDREDTYRGVEEQL